MRIVVVDDNQRDRDHFARALGGIQDADVLAVGSLAGNVGRIMAHQPMMLLLDDRLGPNMCAEDSLGMIAQEINALPTVVMSSDVRPCRRADLIRRGAMECVDKDALDADMLDLIVAMAAQRDRLLKRGRSLREVALD